MGAAVDRVEFEATDADAAAAKASRLGLRPAGRGDGDKVIAVIGVKRLGRA